MSPFIVPDLTQTGVSFSAITELELLVKCIVGLVNEPTIASDSEFVGSIV